MGRTSCLLNCLPWSYSSWKDTHFRNCDFENCSFALSHFNRCEFRGNTFNSIGISGSKTDFERVKPVFEAMGSTITYCGPVGHGQLTKLSNQILVSLTLLGVCEAVLFAEKNGLEPEVMIEAVRGGAAGSWQLSTLGPRIARADYAPGFMVDLLQKDLGLVLEAGYQARVSLMGTSLVRQLMSAAQSMGDGREGTQVLARVLKTLAAPSAPNES